MGINLKTIPAYFSADHQRAGCHQSAPLHSGLVVGKMTEGPSSREGTGSPPSPQRSPRMRAGRWRP